MSPLGDYDDWYLDLVTHEYTHIAHTDNVSGIPALINAILGKTYVPNQIQPKWIIEGLAVVHETQHSSAGRLRASLFDMQMRADVLRTTSPASTRSSTGALAQGTPGTSTARASRLDQRRPRRDTMRAVSTDHGPRSPRGVSTAPSDA
jgi:hypothetical protein